MKKADMLCLALAAAAVVLAIAGWLLLPDRVAMQVSMNGTLQNYMPKPLAVPVMLGLQVLMIGLYRSSKRGGYLAAALVTLVLPVATIWMNL